MSGPLRALDGSGPLLALDTATRQAVLALAEPGGRLVASETWTSGHRHGEELLARLDALLARAGTPPADLSGVVVGIGPGSFTGLRIGLATAKVLAYSLGVPLCGVATTLALARALAASGRDGELALVLPAGARDRYVARYRLAGDRVEQLAPAQIVASLDAVDVGSAMLAAVDLTAPEVPDAAAELGRSAVHGLPAALAAEGEAALAAGRHDDVATLVPAYVALPRGIAAAAQEMQWSPDLR